MNEFTKRVVHIVSGITMPYRSEPSLFSNADAIIIMTIIVVFSLYGWPPDSGGK